MIAQPVYTRLLLCFNAGGSASLHGSGSSSGPGSGAIPDVGVAFILRN
jgi:hypothetical protein